MITFVISFPAQVQIDPIVRLPDGFSVLFDREALFCARDVKNSIKIGI